MTSEAHASMLPIVVPVPDEMLANSSEKPSNGVSASHGIPS